MTIEQRPRVEDGDHIVATFANAREGGGQRALDSARERAPGRRLEARGRRGGSRAARRDDQEEEERDDETQQQLKRDGECVEQEECVYSTPRSRVSTRV